MNKSLLHNEVIGDRYILTKFDLSEWFYPYAYAVAGYDVIDVFSLELPVKDKLVSDFEKFFLFVYDIEVLADNLHLVFNIDYFLNVFRCYQEGINEYKYVSQILSKWQPGKTGN